jgi:hypothetical protein
MSKFLGGDSVNHDDRRGLIGELNEELKQSLSSFEPVRNRIGSVYLHFLMNIHLDIGLLRPLKSSGGWVIRLLYFKKMLV